MAYECTAFEYDKSLISLLLSYDSFFLDAFIIYRSINYSENCNTYDTGDITLLFYIDFNRVLSTNKIAYWYNVHKTGCHGLGE